MKKGLPLSGAVCDRKHVCRITRLKLGVGVVAVNVKVTAKRLHYYVGVTNHERGERTTLMRSNTLLNSTALPHRDRAFTTERFLKISVVIMRMHLLVTRRNTTQVYQQV